MTFRKVFKTLLTATFVVVVSLAILWQFLPLFLETAILPGLALDNGIGWQQGRIRRIGLTGFEAGPVIIGRDNAAGITVDSVRADYTPWGLFQKRIEAVTVSGLQLNLAYRDHTVAIQGIDMGRPLPSKKKYEAQQDQAGPTVAIQRIRINHAVVNLDQGDRHLSIPFDLAARLSSSGDVDVLLALYPCGQKVQVAGSWFRTESVGNVSLTANAFSPGRAVAMLETLPGWVVEGAVDLQAQADIRISPFGFSNLVASVKSASFNAAAGNFGLAAGPVTDPTSPPFLFTLRQTGPQHFDITAAGLLVQTRIPLVLDDLEGDLFYDAQAVNAHVRLKTRLPAFRDDSSLPFVLPGGLNLSSVISAKYARDGDWRVEMTDAPGGTDLKALIARDAGHLRVATEQPTYKVRLKGGGGRIKGTFGASIADIRVAAPFGNGEALKLSMQGDIRADNSGPQILPAGSAVLRVSGIRAGIGKGGSNTAIAVPDIQLRAEMETPERPYPENSGPVFRGDLHLGASTLSLGTSQVRLAGIEARVPWQWPAGEDIPRGLMAVGSMQWQNKDMGSLGMTVRQLPRGFGFQGEHISDLLPGLQFGFSGDLSFPDGQGLRAQVAGSLSRPATAPEIDLGRFFKGGRGIYLKGALSGEFKGGYTAGGMKGSACARLAETGIRLPGGDVAIKNLNAGICFPDLPRLTTGPNQVLTFEAATAGNFKVEGGVFHFQLEPFKTLFVEKGRVGWCGGNVRLQPMRIIPGVADYDTRLDCDRLNLAQILEQLSVADAAGEGTVNGTLPISIDDGRIRFDDGFLYSTPGDGGKIRLSGADALMAGIPKGTRQFFQVDLAREALKDFNYAWAKLRLVSEGEDLRMRLQFDGKPGRILPFEYDKAFGGFVRVDADSRGSEFEGISLDVNFRVPLDDLLEYKDVLNLLE